MIVREEPIRRPPLPRGLYAILDVGRWLQLEGAASTLDALISGGARTIQVRAKHLDDRQFHHVCEVARAVTREAGVRLIVNDRPDIAVLVEADGVHLGQTDLPPARVRAWLPESMLVGWSCHDLGQVDEAVRTGAADYLGYGPVYETPTKDKADPVVGLESLKTACLRAAPLPIVAIGGIRLERLVEVSATGAHAVAIASDLLRAPDIAARTREAVQFLDARRELAQDLDGPAMEAPR